MSNPYAYVTNSLYRTSESVCPLVREFFTWWDTGRDADTPAPDTGTRFTALFKNGLEPVDTTTGTTTVETPCGIQEIYRFPRREYLIRTLALADRKMYFIENPDVVLYEIIRKKKYGYMYTVENTVYFSRGDGTELWVKYESGTVTSGITRNVELHLDRVPQDRRYTTRSVIRLTRHGDVMGRYVYDGTDVVKDDTGLRALEPVTHTIKDPVPVRRTYDYSQIQFAVTIHGLPQF